MPTYEYECTTCRHHFDAVQKMADPPLKECPKCGNSVHRVLSGGIGILFQGSGFYVNDSHSGQISSEKSASTKQAEEKSAGDNSSGVKPTGEKSPCEKPSSEKPEKPEKSKEKISAVA